MPECEWICGALGKVDAGFFYAVELFALAVLQHERYVFISVDFGGDCYHALNVGTFLSHHAVVVEERGEEPQVVYYVDIVDDNHRTVGVVVHEGNIYILAGEITERDIYIAPVA